MNQILQNLALINLLNFCKDNKIDPSDTYIVKKKRGFQYSLRRNVSGSWIVSITFHKNALPTYIIHNN